MFGHWVGCFTTIISFNPTIVFRVGIVHPYFPAPCIIRVTVHSLSSMAALTDSKGWFLWGTPAAERPVTWLAALEGQRPSRVWVLPPGPSFPISSQFQLNPLQLLKCGLDKGAAALTFWEFPKPWAFAGLCSCQVTNPARHRQRERIWQKNSYYKCVTC